MTSIAGLGERGRRVAWGLFALQTLLLFAWAIRLAIVHPAPTASGAISADGVRFGKTERERREIFQGLVRGEPADREQAEKESETAVWNRNHDDFFHQREQRRVASEAAKLRLPQWQAWLILDEGFRAHWPPPPGVTLYMDDAPLARTTRPIAQHRVLVSAPK